MINENISVHKFEDIFSSKGRCKIIKLLVVHNELNISKIVRETGLNHQCVEKHLKILIAAGLLQEKNFGRIRIFRYKSENLLAKALKKLILFWDEWMYEGC